ncbi:uncharacterized protein LOC113315835 [Papaver somniferum]|uniref:uncharacterized protein LOC113315835 n=1 Tax=Papaver somniferum TaxID=3469 RepID=UPI000E6FDFB1|nr:uncharacterized protein LOC113315835 [Papaver somniferum]
MDGYSGYNQIKMFEHDDAKTAFRTPIGNFHYIVILFGLKNAGLAQLIASFTPLLRKGANFPWTAVQHEAFQKIQQIFLSPEIMRSPVQGRPLILYTASSNVVIGALLAQEDEEGVEHPIYYYIRTMKDAQLRYSKAERTCLALAHAMQRFKHYLLSNRVVLVSKANPIKFLLSKPSLIGRPAKWMLQMSDFDIVCVSPKAIKVQAVADLLAAFPGEDSTTLQDDVPGEFPEISVVKEEMCLLYFDGSATPSNDIGGAGIVLVSPSGAMHLEIKGDSKLLVNQMNGTYSLKKITLAPFRAKAQRLLTHFACATITHTGRTNNRHADCFAILASKLQFEGSEKAIIVQRRAVSSTWLSQTEDAQANDWRAPIIHELSSSVTEGAVSLKELKNFFFLHGALYHRNRDASLSRCLGDEEAKENLESVHQEVCGQTLVITLYRRLQRLGTAPRSSIGTSPYSLVYGAGAILPTEIKVPSTRIAADSGIRWDEAEVSKSRVAELDILESKRAKVEKYVEAYKQRISRVYNKMQQIINLYSNTSQM